MLYICGWTGITVEYSCRLVFFICIQIIPDFILQANALESGKQGFERDCERHLSLLDQFSPSNIQTNLKVAVMEAEEETERIAEDFMNSKSSPFDAVLISSFIYKSSCEQIRHLLRLANINGVFL